MSAKKHSASKKGRNNSTPTLTGGLITGLVVSTAALTVLLFFAAICVYTTPDPGAFTLVGALAALYLSAFAGGFAASLRAGGDNIAGLLCGGILIVIIFILSLIFNGGASDSVGVWQSVGLHAVILPFSLLGSLAAANIKKSQSRKHKKRH